MALKDKIGEDLFNNLERDGYAVISMEIEKKLLQESTILKEEDSFLYGVQRILKFGDIFMVQETSKKSEEVIRMVSCLEEAEAYFSERKEELNALWESGCCGGKTLCNSYKKFEWKKGT